MKKDSNKYSNAILIGIGMGILLVFITPRCEKAGTMDLDENIGSLHISELSVVIDSLRAEGYAVENHYPAYIRFVKPNIHTDPAKDAVAIAKALQAHTGVSVKVQLDIGEGSYYADPDEGIIDPAKFRR